MGDEIGLDDMTAGIMDADMENPDELKHEDISGVKESFVDRVKKHEWHWVEIVFCCFAVFSVIFFFISTAVAWGGMSMIGAIVLCAACVLAFLFVWNLETQRNLHRVVEMMTGELNRLTNSVKNFEANNLELEQNTKLITLHKQDLAESSQGLQGTVKDLDEINDKFIDIQKRSMDVFVKREKVVAELGAEIYKYDRSVTKRIEEEVLERVFNQFRHADKDKSGKIDREEAAELKELLADIGIDLDKIEDEDGDGEFSRKEVRLLVVKHFKDLNHALKEKVALKEKIVDLEYEVGRNKNQQSKKKRRQIQIESFNKEQADEDAFALSDEDF